MNSSLDKIENLKMWLGKGSINIFGWPFSGKDTQGQKLSDLFNAVLIGGGDILRNSKATPKHVLETINRGVLAPTQDYLNMVTPYISNPEYANKPIIMSSLGRWHGEEESIMQAAEISGHPIKAVIVLNITEDIARLRAAASKRIKDRGEREDDAAEYLITRYEEYRNKTLPVIDFYRKQGLVIEIDGSQTPEKVFNEIIDKLVEKTSN